MADPPLIQSQLVGADGLRAERRRRKSEFDFETVPHPMVETMQGQGWDVLRVNKKSTRMQRPKAVDIEFEDRLWSVLADLGFPDLNKDRTFTIPYGPSSAETKQIDVFAADSETVLVCECKATAEGGKRTNFKTEIERLVGLRPNLLKTIKKEYPGQKVGFIFATSGYALGAADRERLESAGIEHFNEDTVDYYAELASHLGIAARYQLLGALFAGMKIPNMETAVPAIEGRMGGHRYFSFSIQPEKLLKIGYVLHRRKAASNLTPTYQRLIKKTRLAKVKEFVEEGGFFPNSVIINIDSGRRGPRFDPAKTPESSTGTRLGMLQLPQIYRSAYIIDGQHRLYGFSGTNLAATEAIPVVAFVNLSRSEQLSLFMQINENQKAVPKNLRNTLNASLLWDSDDLRLRSKALKLQIAQDLGELRDSPLHGRVVIGEDRATATCCITIDTIRIGLDRGNFCGRFDANELAEDGTFWKGSNESTMKVLEPFLMDVFFKLREALPEQWELGNADGGFVFINAGVESLLRVISDIVDHLVDKEGINPKTLPTDELVGYVEYYLDPLIVFLDELDPEEGSNLRKGYGSGGRVRYWRTLQQAIHDARSDFEPEGMAQYWKDQEQTFNMASFEMVTQLERFMNADFRTRLEGEYGDRWFKDGVPQKVYSAAINLAAEKNRDREADDEVEPWDCLLLSNYREIATYNDKQWRQLFEKRYTKPGDETKQGGRRARTSWMFELNRIRNEIAHPAYAVKESEYEFLVELTEWLIEGKIDNDL